MLVEELKRRAEAPLVHELHDAVQFFEPILQRRAGQHHRVPAAEFLHLARGLGFPVLDPLGLVQNDHVRLPGVDRLAVADDLLVVDQSVESRLGVLREPRLRGAVDHLRRAPAELLDLRFPLVFDRRRGDHEHAALGCRGSRASSSTAAERLRPFCRGPCRRRGCSARGRPGRARRGSGSRTAARRGVSVSSMPVSSCFTHSCSQALARAFRRLLDLAVDELQPHVGHHGGDVFGHRFHVADQVRVLTAPRPHSLFVEVRLRELREFVGVARRQVDAELQLLAVVQRDLRPGDGGLLLF